MLILAKITKEYQTKNKNFLLEDSPLYFNDLAVQATNNLELFDGHNFDPSSQID